MRTIKTLLLVVSITFSSVLWASTEKDPTKSNVVVSEIKALLKKPKFILKNEVFTYVKIVLNDNHEMVVLSVDSENFEIENFIKKRLNYVKLKSYVKGDLKRFIVPVRIIPKI